jgi:hypothetical protein
MSPKRYYVEAVDNLGSLDPAPPRDRTWAVVDRETSHQQSDHTRRADARAEAHRLNTTQKEP